MFCHKCGSENPDEARFCAKCGVRIGDTAAPGAEADKPDAESSTGLSANVAGLLCYVFLWITGIVFVMLEKKSTFVKFHAWQSIMTFGVLNIAAFFIGWIPIVGPILYVLLWILTAILAIVLIVQAYTGRMWKVPGAGDWAEKMANR